MAYDKFTVQKVFKNQIVNIFCNKILDKIYTDFPASETKFVTTNHLAKILQGSAMIPVPAIGFVTNDVAIYNYLVRNLQTIITVNTQLSFKNRIQVVTEYSYFEFWYDETFVSAVDVNGIFCRNINELN